MKSIIDQMKRKDFDDLKKEELIILLKHTHDELLKNKMLLKETRTRLGGARRKIQNLKEKLNYQRARILEFYRNKK